MKLLILDKDGTLVCPKSGNTFVQNPEDQMLLPGVQEIIARYAADGWMMAIVSNQGGCSRQTVKASDVQVGQHVWNTKSVYLGKISEIRSTVFYCDGTGYSIKSDQSVVVAWKTIENAIAEMRYCLKLLRPCLGTEVNNVTAYFCPDMEGKEWWAVKGDTTCFIPRRYKFRHGDHRKPGGGMLLSAILEYKPLLFSVPEWKNKCLMVGDRPEDEQAAKNVCISFVPADRWRDQD